MSSWGNTWKSLVPAKSRKAKSRHCQALWCIGIGSDVLLGYGSAERRNALARCRKERIRRELSRQGSGYRAMLRNRESRSRKGKVQCRNEACGQSKAGRRNHYINRKEEQ